MTTTETDVKNFFIGVLEGLAINVPDMLNCVGDVYEVGSEID